MINSIKNAVNIINCFSKSKMELGVSDLAEILEMNRSTIHHIVKSLHDAGILVRTPNRRYRLGSQLLGWGQIVSEQYKPFFMVTPYLESLMKRTNETAHLAVLENESTCYLAKVQSTHKPTKIETDIGKRLPLYCTGLGKVLLSHQSKKYIDKFLSTQDLEQRTPNTITDPDELREELLRVRKQGYAIDNEEFDIGLFCVAAPIFDFQKNIIASISVSGPEIRLRKKQAKVIEIIKRTAVSISAQLDL